MTAPAQMPSEPEHWTASDCTDDELVVLRSDYDALRAHAESLQAELVRELASHYSTYMQLKDAERKLAEAVAALKDARPFVAEKDDGYGVTNNHTLRVLARIDEATK